MDLKRFYNTKYIKLALIGIITGIANGMFGSGGGTIVVPSLVMFLNVEEHKSHATAISIILPLTIVSAFFYISNNYVNWELTLKVILGGIIGGYAGAKLLNKCPTKVLRKIFGVIMIIGAFKMIFNFRIGG